MKSVVKTVILLGLSGLVSHSLSAQPLSLTTTKRYLDLPVAQAQSRGTM